MEGWREGGREERLDWDWEIGIESQELEMMGMNGHRIDRVKTMSCVVVLKPGRRSTLGAQHQTRPGKFKLQIQHA